MKNIIYIGFLAIVLLFSCSKEQPFSPTSPSDTVESSQITSSTGAFLISDTNLGDGEIDADITDPEKEDKEKTNKKAKN
jgi:hypothetical protein